MIYLLLILVGCLQCQANTMTRNKRKKSRSSAQQYNKKKPFNILLLTVDDLRPEFGESFAFPEILAPNIDRLARRGTVFRQAFCQMPTCGCSRTSVLTGRRPDTTQVLQNDGCFRDGVGHQNWISLPHAFRKHGYTTAGSGKLFHDGVCDGKHAGEDARAWTMPYFHCSCSSGLYDDRCENTNFRPKSIYANATMTVDDMCDGEIVRSAISQLQNVSSEYQSTGKPFFLSVGFRKPHLPHIVPKDYFDYYNHLNVSLPPNPSVPRFFPSEAWNPSWEFLSYGDTNKESKRRGYNITTSFSDIITKKHRRGYFAAVTFVDDMIGRVTSKLEQLGMSQNTIVALWGDHGWHLGDQNEWGKHTMFTRSNRIPLIISMPPLVSSSSFSDGMSVSYEYVEAVDLYPTLLDLAGLPVPKMCRDAVESQNHPQCLEGSSFASIVLKNKVSQHAHKNQRQGAAFSQWPLPHNQKYMGYSVWTDVQDCSYRYTEWTKYQCPRYKENAPACNASQYGPGNWTEVYAVELYDLTHDPEETTNLVGQSSLSVVESHLQKVLRRGWRGIRSKVLQQE